VGAEALSQHLPSPIHGRGAGGEGAEGSADVQETNEAAQLAGLTDEARYRYWHALDARVRAGERLQGKLHHFHYMYPHSKAFAVQQELEEEQQEQQQPDRPRAMGSGLRRAMA